MRGNQASPQAGRVVINRRQAVVGGAVLVGGAFTSPGRALIGALPLPGSAPEPVDRSTMAAHIGRSFRVRTTSGVSATLTLVAVGDLPHTPHTNPEGQFSARFESQSGGLNDQVLTLDGDGFGPAALFVARADEATTPPYRYEAMFNRTEAAAQ